MDSRWILTLIATVLLVSLPIPGEIYSPPNVPYLNGNYDVYQEVPSRVATLLCGAETREYYEYLVNWTLRFPHYHVYRGAGGSLRTAIVVGNWSSFEKSLPYGCEIISLKELSKEPTISHDPALYNASLLLENLTKGTPDYEKLKPFFSFASYSPKNSELPKTNNTHVEVIIIGTRGTEFVWKPFVFVWAIVMVLSAVGLFTSWKRRKKVIFVSFVIILLLGAFFVGKVLYLEHEKAEWNSNVASVLSLKGTGGECWPVVGAINVPSDSGADSIPRALQLINESYAKVLRVSFEDYIVKLEVGVNPESYEELAKEAEELGLQVDIFPKSDVLRIIDSRKKEYEMKKEMIATLDKYLPKLPKAERESVERFIELQKQFLEETEKQLNASKNCYEVGIAIPTEYGVIQYSSLSGFLAKLALLVVGIALVVSWKNDG
ncbi:hypothetical protein [Thermococcus pacificus]|uniref:Uncharacterized protein n=1 Tax=Thermococcus pacificus TaxID=71998 RepID=A0A218P7F0_9EURY|nr:hypothetical protein [Thermococcus pacificus]ASJ06709.1 hypothetical protein A3L08_04940 [Thermococcus pacificus]